MVSPWPGVGYGNSENHLCSTALFVNSAFPPQQAIKLLHQSGAGPKSKLPPTWGEVGSTSQHWDLALLLNPALIISWGKADPWTVPTLPRAAKAARCWTHLLCLPCIASKGVEVKPFFNPEMLILAFGLRRTHPSSIQCYNFRIFLFLLPFHWSGQWTEPPGRQKSSPRTVCLGLQCKM